MAEYAAVIVLTAAILGALVASGVTTTIGTSAANAVCLLTGGTDCDRPDPEQSPEVWDGASAVPEDRGYGQPDVEDPANDKKAREEADAVVDTIDDYLSDDNCGWFTCDVSPEDIDLSQLTPKQREYVLSKLEDHEIERLLGDNLVNSQGDFAGAVMRDASIETMDRLARIDGKNAQQYTHPVVQTVAERNGIDMGINRVPSATLYGDKGEPSSADITQGQLGDCWWLTSLGAVADKNPDLIQDMIEDNGNGKYTVTFPDGEKVEVTDDFAWDREFDTPAFARPSDPDDPAIWPMLLEKAYAQKKGGNYEDIEGGFAHFGMQDLTGDSGETYQTIVASAHDYELPDEYDKADVRKVDKDKHQEALLEAQENGEAMVAATYADPLLTESRKKNYFDHEPSIVANHQYMVEEIDEDNGDVTLINPHDPTERTTVTDNEFYDYFPLVHTNPADN